MTNDTNIPNGGEGPDIDVVVQNLTNIANEVKKFENFFLAMNRTFDQLTTKLDDAIGTQARIEGKLDRIEGKLDRIEGTMDRIEKLLDERYVNILTKVSGF